MRVTGVRTYPLSVPVGDLQRTSQGSFGTISILVVVVETDAGVTGVGEALARFGPTAYAELVDTLLAPKIIGMDPFAVEGIWQRLFRTFSGRSGGMLIEAISAIDIAIWDILGKVQDRPVYELLGHMGRSGIRAYASSIPWVDDEGATKVVEDCLEDGFREMKVKIGAPVEASIARARLVREVAGPDIRLMADSNWIFDVDDAVITLGSRDGQRMAQASGMPGDASASGQARGEGSAGGQSSQHGQSGQGGQRDQSGGRPARPEPVLRPNEGAGESGLRHMGLDPSIYL